MSFPWEKRITKEKEGECIHQEVSFNFPVKTKLTSKITLIHYLIKYRFSNLCA